MQAAGMQHGTAVDNTDIPAQKALLDRSGNASAPFGEAGSPQRKPLLHRGVDGAWWAAPLLQPSTALVFCTPMHIAISLASCFFWAAIRYVFWPPQTMFHNTQDFLQCTTVIAGFQCVVADNARIKRVLRRRSLALAFYATMNVTLITWFLIDHYLPRRYFIMLSLPELKELSPGGWILFVVAVLIVLFSVCFQITEAYAEQRLRKPGWWLPFASLAAAVLAIGFSVGFAGRTSFHMHHYMWAGLLALFMRYESKISIFSQAIMLGIFNVELTSGIVRPFFDLPHHS